MAVDIFEYGVPRAHLQPRFPAMFSSNFFFNTRCIPKPYLTSTIRISSRFFLQLCRSPYFDSNKPYFITSTIRISSRFFLQLCRSSYYDSKKPYFITYYAIWTKTSRFKDSMIWVFLPSNKRLNWLKSGASMVERLHNRLLILKFARCHNKRQRTLRFTGKHGLEHYSSVFCFPLPLFSSSALPTPTTATIHNH